jgi:hypothetical protein
MIYDDRLFVAHVTMYGSAETKKLRAGAIR